MNLPYLTLSENAMAYGWLAHLGHKRKYTGVPYFVHVQEVADLVRSVGGTQEMIAAAYLHDVIEDRELPNTRNDIKTLFGKKVYAMVVALTNLPTVKGGPNRAARHAMDCARLAAADADVQTIKLADLISNTKDIVAHDPKFAKQYLAEKAKLLTVMTKGNPVLMAKALANIN